MSMFTQRPYEVNVAEHGAKTATIIVIAYNEEAHIKECLQALLNQQLVSDFKIVVVDDGSTDATAAVVSTVADHASQVQLIQHRINRGRGAARRTGQDACSSEHIGFIDADILVPSNWLFRMQQELEEVYAVSGIALPDGDVAVVWRIARPLMKLRKGSAEITGNNVLFRASALQRCPFEETSRLGEDFRLAKRMKRLGLNLQTVSDVVVDHRESKSYRDAFKWMWLSGVDATSLLVEFQEMRVPDYAWICWLIVSLTFLILAATTTNRAWIDVLGEVGVVSVINVAFITSRFQFISAPFRFAYTAILNLPLMSAYLAGRTYGLVRWSVRSLIRGKGVAN